jgi:hypothetical protein
VRSIPAFSKNLMVSIFVYLKAYYEAECQQIPFTDEIGWTCVQETLSILVSIERRSLSCVDQAIQALKVAFGGMFKNLRIFGSYAIWLEINLPS